MKEVLFSPCLHPRFCSGPCFLNKIFSCRTASFLLKELYYFVKVSHLGRQASLVTYEHIIIVIKPKIIRHVLPIIYQDQWREVVTRN